MLIKICRTCKLWVVHVLTCDTCLHFPRENIYRSEGYDSEFITSLAFSMLDEHLRTTRHIWTIVGELAYSNPKRRRWYPGSNIPGGQSRVGIGPDSADLVRWHKRVHCLRTRSSRKQRLLFSTGVNGSCLDIVHRPLSLGDDPCFGTFH